MQSSWCGDGALPDVQYAVSENGWMTSIIFEDFFKTFVDKTAGTRPLLLILDGHLSHTTLKTVELAIKENITILKLPPRCTDLLQPLDVACFSPLKNRYETELTDFVHKTAAREPLRKSGFVNMLCSVWKQGLSPANIKAGFRATGIVPFNRLKYNVDRLDSIKLEIYKRWVNNGKPRNNSNEPIIYNQQKRNTQLTEADLNQFESPVSVSSNSTPIAPLSSINHDAQPGCSTWSSHNNDLTPDFPPPSRSVYDVLDELKSYIPDNKGIVQFVHELECKRQSSLSVEDILLSRGKTLEPAQKKKRHNIPMTAQVITHKECVEEKRKRENKDSATSKKKKIKSKQATQEKKNSQKKGIKTAAKRKLNVQHNNDNSISISSVSSIETDKQNSSSEMSPSELPRQDSPIGNGISCAKAKRSLKVSEDTNNNLQKIVIDEHALNKYVAVFYLEPKPRYIWGKILKTFEDDEDAEVNQIEIEFLKRKCLSRDPKFWTWHAPLKKDVKIVDVKYVLVGPCIPDVRSGKFYFPNREASDKLVQI